MLEIERKWLLRLSDDTFAGWPWQVVLRGSSIEQTYLTAKSGCERVRSRHYQGVSPLTSTVELTHTIKHATDRPGIRHEVERVVTVNEYEALLERGDPALVEIRKTRRVFRHAGREWELDEFWSPFHVGILELELPSLDVEVELPPWLDVVREVTDEPGWTNVELADIEGTARRLCYYMSKETMFYSGPEERKMVEWPLLVYLTANNLREIVPVLVSMFDDQDAGWLPLRALIEAYPDVIKIDPEDYGRYDLLCKLYSEWWDKQKAWYEGEGRRYQ